MPVIALYPRARVRHDENGIPELHKPRRWGRLMTRNGWCPFVAMLVTATLLAPQAVAQTRQQIDWCNNKGNALSFDQRISGCTALVESGRASVQNRAIGYVNRCWAYSDKGDPERAIADCDEAIALDPNLPIAYSNRSNADQEKGDLDRAIADSDQAIRLDPKFANGYYNRGAAYARKDDFDRAIADFDQAIRLDPKFIDAYYSRGTVYYAKGDDDRAIAAYNQTIQLDPKFSQGYFGLGIVSLYAGALPKALADINRASALDPKAAYTALWQEIVNKRSHLPSRLAHAMTHIDMTKWPAPIIRLYLGQTTPGAVLAAADDPVAYKQKGQVCEANFFSGELALQQNSKDEATRLFRIAAEGCPYDFYEWTAAKAELKTLGAQP
jgi:tetratricopeptide (TPR) repeat protein